MASFKKVQEMLCLCLVEEIIGEEEFVLLGDTYRPRNLPFPHWAYEKFSLANTDPAECKADSRVEKRDIRLLVDALTVPPVFRSRNGKICDGAEGLCIMPKRFAYPCWYSDIIPIFGQSVQELSMISNEVVDWMYTTLGHKITQWNHDLSNPAALNEYADAISNKGPALENCFGFIDGTLRPISRPDENQRIVYNGHKRVHTLKFQSILPNGLIGHLYDPVGRFIPWHPIQVVRHKFLILELFSSFSKREGCTMHECWQLLVCMTI